jgi:hypothetical protein
MTKYQLDISNFFLDKPFPEWYKMLKYQYRHAPLCSLFQLGNFSGPEGDGTSQLTAHPRGAGHARVQGGDDERPSYGKRRFFLVEKQGNV